MVDASGPSALAPLGSSMGTGGGHCWRYRQHPPGGLPSTSPTLVVAAVGHVVSTPQGGRYQRLQIRWWPLSDLSPAPPRGLTIDVSTLVVATAGPTASTPEGGRHRRLHLRWWPLSDLSLAPPRGPAIDVSNFDGGRCQTCHQHSLGGPPSTSSTSVVAAVGDTGSTPRGCHRRLQLRWWSLLDLPPAPPRGPAIAVSNFSGGRCWTYHQHSPVSPPSTSSTLVVAAVGDTDSTPRRPAIDIFNFGGGRCQRYWQHPPLAPHRCLQFQWWPLPEISAALLMGPAINVSNFGGGHYRIYRQHPLGDPPSMSSTSVVAAAGDTDSTPRRPAIDVFKFGSGH
jgi:hypothetical protein